MLVKQAIEQSRNREPMVRTMALLYGARVLAAVDAEAAKQAFAEGVAAAESLPLHRHRELVLDDAVRLGSFADPPAAVALFRRLPPGRLTVPRRSAGTMLVQALVHNGSFEAALELLEDLNCEVGGAQAVVHLAADPAVQRRAMFAARERWRAARKHPDLPEAHFTTREFYRFFSQHWRKLEPNEQEDWLDEILRVIETDPDRQGGRFGFGGKVEFHSTRDMRLFEILNVLRALKPADQVEAILRAQPAVAEAAEIYPLGLESLMAERSSIAKSGQRGGGFGYVGSASGSDSRSLADVMALRRGDPSAVQHLLTEAHHLYQEDTDPNNPNMAPRVFWPSCHAYKVAMYWAGKSSGKDAEPLLAEIPDADFALLASIELAAGVLGLPEHCGWHMGNHPRRTHSPDELSFDHLAVVLTQVAPAPQNIRRG